MRKSWEPKSAIISKSETSLKRVEFVLLDKPSLYVFQHAFGKVAD